MTSIFDFTFTYITATLFTVIVLAITVYYKWTFNYWKRKSFPYLENPIFPFGNLPIPFIDDINAASLLKHFYGIMKSRGHKHAGYYASLLPTYVPIDPEYIKNILQNGFSHFVDHGLAYNEKDDPLSANLVYVESEKWRYLRPKLTPAFTPRKIRLLFDTMLQCSFQMRDALKNLCKNEGQKEVDMGEASGCYATDLIGLSAFGLDCNSFKYPDAEFRKHGKHIVHFSIIRLVKVVIYMFCPKIARWLGLIQIADKKTTEFFLKVVRDAVEFRKNHKVVRNDVLSLLIQLKEELNLEVNGHTTENKSREYEKAIEEIAAQVYIFFVGGFGTTAATLSFCLYELSANPNIQEKVRNEINDVLSQFGGEITYDAVINMKYLYQVVDETLRKYPALPIIPRLCGEDYKVPGTDFVVEKGTHVILPILQLHHDPDYYPEPEKFDPDRFSNENKQKIQPYTYLPFGEGPKVCIGSRYTMMAIPIALVVLLKYFKFSLKKNAEGPIKFAVNDLFLSPKLPLFLNIEKV